MSVMEQLVEDIGELKEVVNDIKNLLIGSELDSDGLVKKVKEHEIAILQLLRSDVSTKMILKQIEWFGKIVGAAVITGIVTFIIYLATKNGH